MKILNLTYDGLNYKKSNKVECKDLGLVTYSEAWNFQNRVFQEIVAQKVSNRELDVEYQCVTKNFIFSCQHPHVYTIGKSGKLAHLLLSQNELLKHDAEFFETNRGGDITYHGPGQIVIYPVLDLENFFTDIHKYLRFLEEAVIVTLSKFGIEAGRVEGLTGVWLGANSANPRKICAMGIRSSRWVVMHGLALNVNPDLNYFNYIIPCGISDKAVTSMQKECSIEIDIEKVKNELITNIITQFSMSLI